MKNVLTLLRRMVDAVFSKGAQTHPLVPAHHGVDAVSMAQELTDKGYLYCLHHLGKPSRDAGPIMDNIAHVTEVLEFLDDENQALCISLSPDQLGYERSEKIGSKKAVQLARNFRNRVQARDVENRQVQRAEDLTGEDHGDVRAALAVSRPLLSIHASPKVPMQQVLALSARLSRAGVPVHQTLPAALQRSVDDAKVLISQGMHIRVALDPTEVLDANSFQEADLIDENYRAIAALLLSEDALIEQIRPVFALESDELADHVLSLAQAQGWQPEHFEFEIPYGVNVALKQRLRDKGYQVRVLLPFGKEWRPYVARLK